jgi:small GTP-binding protein
MRCPEKNSAMTEHSLRAKVVLTGRSGVGKTSLVRRYVSDEFSERHVETVGVRVEKRTEIVNGIHVELMVWDVAGEMSLTSLQQVYLSGAVAIVYVADGTDLECVAGYQSYIDSCRAILDDPFEVALLNKIDLPPDERALELFEEVDIADRWKASAKAGTSVQACFQSIAAYIVKRHENI